MKPKVCVHCLKPLGKKTKDHVFPRSWYPENTPDNIQRWTVPSCPECNAKYGEMEKELFIRAAICVGPVKAEAAGLSKKAVESMGVGVPGLSAEEKAHREALKSKILKEVKPHVPGTQHFPGLGPHLGFSETQYEIPISEKLIKEVAEKIVRGCEFKLGEQRLIEEPYILDIYFAEEATIGDVLKVFDRFSTPVHLGPGFRVRRVIPTEEPKTVLYRIDIWGTWTIYASIMVSEAPAPKLESS
jgi:hypothetical protein